MKAKNFSKKLRLSKETIVDLNKSEMKAVQGGFPKSIAITHCTCPTCSAPGNCC
jgi:natural product precursor